MKPTPGPWRINTSIEDSAGCIVECADGRMICECYEDGEPQTDEDRANAKAIAALPKLLNERDALEFALRRIDVATVGAFCTNSKDIDDWREDIDWIQALARVTLAALEKK